MNDLYFSSSSKVWEKIEWVFGIEEAGYDGWEISADGNYRLDIPENRSQIADLLGSVDLGVTVHAPYTDLNLASLNYPIWRESIRQICLCIEHAAEFTDLVTIHPGYLSPAGKLVPEKVWALQKEALMEIGRYSADCGVMTCLENMIDIDEFLCRTPGELFGITEGLEGIGVTLDLGHANTCGLVDEFLGEIGKADHLHIHDNNGRRDEHLALGAGTIPWDRVGRTVSKGFSGICVVEGRNLQEARISLAAFRRWFV
jgi:sugar phosphate isomerase/epimerase